MEICCFSVSDAVKLSEKKTLENNFQFVSFSAASTETIVFVMNHLNWRLDVVIRERK